MFEPARWERFFDGLRTHFGASSASILLHDLNSGGINAFFQSGGDPGLLQEYGARFAASDPWVKALDRFPAGRMLAGEDLVPAEVIRKSAFYNEWARRAETFHVL